ncbi:PIN domain-containing protein [Candidatus Woesearchaeota archaeon]|nr:PIN domain-containing protein [Candidatus Woesearchaeota archaeon]
MTENPYYWDANVWLDIYEKRGYANEVATKLLRNIIIEDGIIFYSDLVIDELKKVGYSQYEILQIFSIAKPDHLKKVHIYKKQIDEARRVAKKHDVPEADALHAILARDNQFTLVSRDQKDFPKLRYIWPAKLPEDFL